MPGLIENNLSPVQSKIYQADTEDYDPTLRDVDAPTETVAGQLHSLLSSGSPYLERAKAGARETANSRGLLNSSMAAGAGEAAAIDAALPIASADANIYNTKSRDNQGYSNTAGQFNAGAKNTSNLQAATAANTRSLQTLAGQQDIQKIIASGAETRKNIGAQGQETRLTIGTQTGAERQLMDRKAQIDLELQSADANTRLRLLQEQGQIENQLQTLRGEQTMAQQSQAAANEIVRMGYGAELEQVLQGQRGDIQSQLQAEQAANKLKELGLGAQLEQVLIGARAEAESGLIRDRTTAESKLIRDREQAESALQAQRAQQAMGLQTLQGQQTTEQINLKAAHDIALQQLRGDQAERVTLIDRNFATLIQAMPTAASIYNGIIKNINDIMGNAEIDPENKQVAIDLNIDLLESGLAILGGISDLDLTSLLTFNGA